MPIVINTSVSADSKLGVWRLTEPLEELENLFPLLKHEEEQYKKYKNNKRKREWLVSRILLTELLQERAIIKYSKYGKPFLDKETSKISISHSKNHVAVIVSNNFNPGVDIEHIAERVQKVKHKFLQAHELEWCKSNELMTLCWSAKEAIFKIYEKELDFHDIIIVKFDENDTSFYAFANKNKVNSKFKIYFERIENDVLTYTFRLI